MTTCTCCNRAVAEAGLAVHFPCPSCGEVEIWRCPTCRRISNPYRCPNCGFTGP